MNNYSNSIYLPMGYYLVSRYSCWEKRIFYLIKYFGVYPVLLYFLGIRFNAKDVFTIFFNFICFYNIYDIFCFNNDLIDLPEHRKINLHITAYNFIVIKILISIAFNILLYILSAFYFDILFFQFTLIIIFCWHNYVKITKLLSFFLLYFMKSGIFIVPFLSMFRREDIFIYLVFALFFNLSYLPRYSVRKLNLMRQYDANLFNKPYLQAIIFKNLFMTVLSFWNIIYIYPLIYTNLITFAEYLVEKYILPNKTI
jgi:hypothetical protein